MRLLGKKALSVFMAGIIIFSVFSFGIGLFTVSAANVTGDEIVEYARQYLGYPYVHGTYGPDSFDCSGFVYYVFKHFGITLSTDSNVYYKTPEKFGTVIDISEVQAGDVMVWSGHVGIYTYNGNMINASNPTDGVKENEWKYYGASPKVIRINGVGIDNNTYANFIKPNKDNYNKAYLVKGNDDRIDVSIKGRQLSIQITSESFNNGKVRTCCEKEEHKNGFGLLRLYINDYSFDPFTEPSGNNHSLEFKLYCRTNHDSNGYVQAKNLEYEMIYATSWHLLSCIDGKSRYFPGGRVLFSNEHTAWSGARQMETSYSGNTITFECTLPYSYETESEIYTFNNKDLSLYLDYYALGLNYGNNNNSSGEQSFFDNFVNGFKGFVENAKNILFQIIDTIKKAFSAMFGG